MSEKDFIQTRLEKLQEIDDNIIQLLDNIGGVFETYSEPSRQSSDGPKDIKLTFEEGVKNVYTSLSSIAINLRHEIKIMDDNIGVYDKNDDLMMILPITVEQKNTTLGSKKLQGEINKMKTT